MPKSNQKEELPPSNKERRQAFIEWHEKKIRKQVLEEVYYEWKKRECRLSVVRIDSFDAWLSRVMKEQKLAEHE